MRDFEIRMYQPSCSMICYKSASNYSGEQHTALDWWIRGRSLHQAEFMMYEMREDLVGRRGKFVEKKGTKGSLPGLGSF